MGHSNSKITAPVSLHADVYPVLGLTKTGDFYDVGYVNSNKHGQTNRYSYIKPIEEQTPSEIQFTNAKYIASLTPVRYKGGSQAPTECRYVYNAPGSYFRLTDWDGYDHNEYPVRASLASLPETVDFEHEEEFSVTYNDSKRPLLSMLLSQTTSGSVGWFNKIVIVIRIGSQWRAFSLKDATFDLNKVRFALIDKSLYLLLRNNGASTFSCTALLVGVPYGHGDATNHQIHEITNDGLQYTIFPQSAVCTPFKSFTLNKPQRRCFMTLYINDSGNGRELWVPDGTQIQALLKYNNETIFVLSSYGFDQGEVYEEEDSRVNLTTNYVSGEVQIPDAQFPGSTQWVRPQIQSNADRTNYDAVLQTTFLYWDRKVAGDEFEINVGFTYADPNYRPEY